MDYQFPNSPYEHRLLPKQLYGLQRIRISVLQWGCPCSTVLVCPTFALIRSLAQFSFTMHRIFPEEKDLPVRVFKRNGDTYGFKVGYLQVIYKGKCQGKVRLKIWNLKYMLDGGKCRQERHPHSPLSLINVANFRLACCCVPAGALKRWSPMSRPMWHLRNSSHLHFRLSGYGFAGVTESELRRFRGRGEGCPCANRRSSAPS